MRRSIIRLLLILALLPATAFSGDATYRSLETGQPVALESFQQAGKWLVVMVWASDCPVCNREASHYSDFHMLHSDDDATILGISIDGWDGRDAAQAFVDKHQVSFPNVVVEAVDYMPYFQQVTGDHFRGTPTFLLYDPEGVLRAQQAGAVPVELIEEFIAR